jgi:hypothetical protein
VSRLVNEFVPVKSRRARPSGFSFVSIATRTGASRETHPATGVMAYKVLSVASIPIAMGVLGFIDQGNRYHDFVNHDLDSAPERPGIFQASVIVIGHLVAYSGL